MLSQRSYAQSVSGQYWFANVVARCKRAGVHPWFEDVLNDELTAKLEGQGKAFQVFFEGRGRSPLFERKRDRQGVRLNFDRRRNGKRVAWAGVQIVAPIIGALHVRRRLLPAEVAKWITVSRETDGRWFVTFTADEDASEAFCAREGRAHAMLGTPGERLGTTMSRRLREAQRLRRRDAGGTCLHSDCLQWCSFAIVCAP